MKTTAPEQASRDWKRIVGKTKDDADDSSDLWRDQPLGFDAFGQPIPLEPDTPPG
jgi:hypothetical protein